MTLQVGELESQIDNFEAEIEGLSVKKGKTRPPRLVRKNGKAFKMIFQMFIEIILLFFSSDTFRDFYYTTQSSYYEVRIDLEATR